MPPKAKYTREQIIDAAYELARESGIDAVVAREVGKRLNTTVSPIFTAFENMEDLKEQVREKAAAVCCDYLKESFEYMPAFKEFGLRWVGFAIEEPNLYRLMFQGESRAEGVGGMMSTVYENIIVPMVAEVEKVFVLSREDAMQLMNEMILLANGIAAFSINGAKQFTREEISKIISEVCIGLVLRFKVINGTFSLPMADQMANAADRLPVRKDALPKK